MDLFKRNRLSSDFYAAPREPSGAELVAQAATIDREQVVTAFNRLAYDCRLAGRMDLVDRVLDERLAIRPPCVVEATPLPRRTT